MRYLSEVSASTANTMEVNGIVCGAPGVKRSSETVSLIFFYLSEILKKKSLLKSGLWNNEDAVSGKTSFLF